MWSMGTRQIFGGQKRQWNNQSWCPGMGQSIFQWPDKTDPDYCSANNQILKVVKDILSPQLPNRATQGPPNGSQSAPIGTQKTHGNLHIVDSLLNLHTSEAPEPYLGHPFCHKWVPIGSQSAPIGTQSVPKSDKRGAQNKDPYFGHPFCHKWVPTGSQSWPLGSLLVPFGESNGANLASNGTFLALYIYIYIYIYIRYCKIAKSPEPRFLLYTAAWPDPTHGRCS